MLRQRDFDSMESCINRKVLLAMGFPPNSTKQQVRSELLAVCPPDAGWVAIPTDHRTGLVVGVAYLNFNRTQEAKQALDSWRFRLKVAGHKVRLGWSVHSERKDDVFGEWGHKFIVVVKNISEEVDVQALHDRFVEYGEIFQCKTDHDGFGQYYGSIHYIEEYSVHIACQQANGVPLKGYNTIMQVIPRKSDFFSHATNAPAPSINSAQNFPSTGGSARSSGTTPRSAQYQQQQQQQSLGLQDQPQQQQPQQQPQQDVVQPVSGVAMLQAPQGEVQYSNDAYYQPQAYSYVLPVPSNPYAQHVTFTTQPQSTPAFAPATPGGHSTASTSIYDPNGYAQQPTPSTAAAPQPAPYTAAAEAGGLGAIAAPVRLTLRNSLHAALHHLERLSEMLVCPITQECMREPVIAADGYTYEREAIAGWLEEHHTSPMTNEDLPNKLLVLNILVKSIIEEFAS